MTDNKPLPDDQPSAISDQRSARNQDSQLPTANCQPATDNRQPTTDNCELMDGDLLAQLEDQPYLWRRVMLDQKRHMLATTAMRSCRLVEDIAQIRANPVLTDPLREMMIEVRQDHLRRLRLFFDDCVGSNYPFSLN